jgi:hypothetical protein
MNLLFGFPRDYPPLRRVDHISAADSDGTPD